GQFLGAAGLGGWCRWPDERRRGGLTGQHARGHRFLRRPSACPLSRFLGRRLPHRTDDLRARRDHVLRCVGPTGLPPWGPLSRLWGLRLRLPLRLLGPRERVRPPDRTGALVGRRMPRAAWLIRHCYLPRVSPVLGFGW